MIIIDPPRHHALPRGAPALFLDRDGVVNRDDGHVHRSDDFHFLDGIFDLGRAATAWGYVIVLTTNQAGIARGAYTEDDFRHLSLWMVERMAAAGVDVARVTGCPHHPDFPSMDLEAPCGCRKPAPGMLLRAATDFALDLDHSILIGDKESDIEAGLSAGVGTRLLFGAPLPGATTCATAVLHELREALAYL